MAMYRASTHNDSMHWYIDSGATMHMTMHKDWLEDISTSNVKSIRIADNKVLHVEGCGNVTINVPDEQGSVSKIQVRNVLYVPDLSTNLLSVSKIIKSGCKIEFNESECNIFNQNGQNIAKAGLVSDLYKLITNEKKAQAFPAVVDEDVCLWHQRMGHLNFTDTNKLPSCTTGVKLSPSKEDIKCISCIEAKQTRQSFPSEGSRATELLEVIHSDVCGPMQTASLGGARYFVTFIDDLSRKVFVYPIKSKAEVLEKFNEFKNLVENELNKKIKKLRTDNGKEYINRNFDSYLKKSGILHQTTVPYTPEQNGLSERMNRTIIEKSKCMLFNAQLQNCYWAEAVVTAAYIINRSPTKSLSNITPEEVWSGEKPDLSHIRIFGCRAMVHIPKERRQKLDAKSRELIFVGYCTGTKGYRFIDPKSKQSITSRDVVFLEATVSRNIVINKSASETKEIISNHKNNEEKNDTEKKNNKKELCIPVNKMITIPFSEPDRNDDAQEKESSSGADPDDSNTTLHNNSSDASTSTQSHYSDPDDETYVPEESSSSYISDDSIQELNKVLKSKRREEIYEPDLSINEDNVFTNTSFACMNGEFTMGIIDKDPQSLSEALQSNKADKWMEAMKEEHNSLLLNNTWTLVDLPPNKKVIPCKWVYRTKPDIAYIVNQLSRFNNKPTSQHWIAAKRVLRYLKGTLNTKMMFKKNNSDIVGYCDADWASDTEDRRSCSGYVFLFQGAAISWCSKRQPTIALSSTEAEYMSLTIAVQEAIWLKQLEEDFWPTLTGTPILIYCDNQSTISISGNDIYHARSKHIDVRYHFVRERISNNQVTIRYKNTEDMVADVLTKGLPRPKHQFFSNALGLRSEERVGF
ncbi:hypothetical protein JYU34_013686 [Plutella xylostella]|uniref:Integrase catalytic domain-containing protein n=1 Tax=Plutella xylostella TaxID=51655 RepID=A0ABQ7QAV2_PLUXY|nr:hypothetical protein JYU34_013686 [Plutella xylostella]